MQTLQEPITLALTNNSKRESAVVVGMTNAKLSASGIVDDPSSSNGARVIPQSRRADGSIRKERKVKPGFTPAEDVARFVPSRVRQARAAAEQSASKANITMEQHLPKPHLMKKDPERSSNGDSSRCSTAIRRQEVPRVQSSSPSSIPKQTASSSPERHVPESWDDEEEEQQGDEKRKTKAQEADTSSKKADDSLLDEIADDIANLRLQTDSTTVKRASDVRRPNDAPERV